MSSWMVIAAHRCEMYLTGGEGVSKKKGVKKKKSPSTFGQSLSCLYHDSFPLDNNKLSFSHVYNLLKTNTI